MADQLRKTGIDVLGDIPWGTHFCHFYQTKRDFVELLTAYFKTGLENNEYCLWAISNPFNVEKVMNSLKQSMPGFDDHLARKSFEIIPITESYLKNGKFNPKEIVNEWVRRLQNALDRGYDGMRIHGNKGWLEEDDWEIYQQYEKELSRVVFNHRMIVLCTYPLAKSDASTFLDIVHLHGRVVSTRKGKWKVLQEAEIDEIHKELRKQNEELETRVELRTQELENTIRKLENEIAERKKVEAQLIREKEIANEIFDNIPALVVIVDENFRYVRWSKNLEKVTGYSPETLSTIHAIEDFFPDAESKQIAYEKSKEIIEKGAASYEIASSFKNESQITYHLEGRRINYEGKPCLLILSVDISERKNAEMQLARQKELSNEIIDSIPGLVGLFDQNRNFLLWNRAFEVASGYTSEEIRHLHGVDSFYDNDHDKEVVNEILNEMFTTGFGSAEVRPLMKDGIAKTIFFNGRRIVYEGKPCLLVIGIDISDRKIAEERLKASELLLAEAAHLAHVGSWSLDFHTNKVTWSDECYVMFGIKPSEFDYSLDAAIQYAHPDDRDLIYQNVEEAIKTRNPFDFHYRMRRPDGDERIIHVCGAVVTDEEGNATRMYGAVQDVTESKQTEKMMKESYQQIRSLTEHLQNIREEERTHIAREIHDELGQQLTVLKMDVAWLSKKINGTDHSVKEKLHELTGLLDNTVQSVRRIASELRPSMLDDLGLAATMDWHLTEFRKRSGIKTSFQEPEEELELPGPVKTGLFRIFQESLTNVVKHSNASEVQVALVKNNTHVLLQIKDNGIGFDQQEVVQKKTLGILGMKERVAMMGGTYKIQSLPRKGTTISIDIPLSQKI